ncbi:MAG: tetratricopeptide repeat protein [Pirellula sp.]
MDIESAIDELTAKYGELVDHNLERSALLAAQECRRLAKSERLLIPYLHASFRAMIRAVSVLQPEMGRDLAIELIALLESETAARNFQADFAMEEYEHAVHWMSSCAYDNLATCVASMEGFNSGEMHQCIHEGIEVCRRTGKLQCITCFREYATEVYAAADDLDMSIHFAKVGMATAPSGDQDRRWSSARNLIELYTFNGDLLLADETAKHCSALIPTYHTPSSAAISGWLVHAVVTTLLGAETPEAPPFPQSGETPFKEMKLEQLRALQSAIDGKADEAIDRLMGVERLLRERKFLSEMLRNRLQLLATLRFAGRSKPLEKMAAETLEWAHRANDHFTQRCVPRILDASQKACPYPTLQPIDAGPFASRSRVHGTDSVTEPDASKASAANAETVDFEEQIPVASTREIPAFIQEWMEGLNEAIASDIESPLGAIEGHRLKLLDRPLPLADANEAAWTLHCMTLPLGPYSQPEVVWDWGQRVIEPFGADGACINLLAFLGFQLQSYGFEGVDVETVGDMFAKSLPLVPDGARSFFRAGLFHLYHDEPGEAERCLARAFRLSREDSGIANTLSQLYATTEREADGLAVLDMCIRAGCREPETLLRAALFAESLEKYSDQLLYLKTLVQTTGGDAMIDAMLASCLIDLEQWDNAKVALDAIDASECPEEVAATSALLAATVAVQESDLATTRRLSEAVLKLQIASFGEVPTHQIYRRAVRWWKLLQQRYPNDSITQKAIEWLLCGSLAPVDWFESLRHAEFDEPGEGVNFYEVVVRQPLDRNWDRFPGCHTHHRGWTEYLASWGVLATTAEDAERRVLAMQGRCYPRPAAIESIKLLSEDFEDRPGVVWQGLRESSLAQDDD